MDTKPSLEPATADSTVADDLTTINGIGPTVMSCLHEGSVHTFAQLAGMSVSEVLALVQHVKGMTRQRIERENWIEQAREKVQEKQDQVHHSTDPVENHQHYATFTVRLLLDAENNVRRTQVEHIQSEDRAPVAWAGWDDRRLVTYIAKHAAFRLAAGEQPAASASEPPGSQEALHLSDMETWSPDMTRTQTILRHDRPFQTRMTLDLSEVKLPQDKSAYYTVTVYAKSLNKGSRQIIGEVHNTAASPDRFGIDIRSGPLPQDTYRLEAIATLDLSPARTDLTAYLEGGILHVY